MKHLTRFDHKRQFLYGCANEIILLSYEEHVKFDSGLCNVKHSFKIITLLPSTRQRLNSDFLENLDSIQ